MTATPRILSELEARFARAYVANGGKAVPAALEAGYKPAGAHVRASVLLRRPHVMAAIKEHRSKAAARVEFTAASILQDIYEIGNEARAAGDHSAALKSRQMLGESLPDPLFVKTVRRQRAPMTPADRAARLAALTAKATA